VNKIDINSILIQITLSYVRQLNNPYHFTKLDKEAKTDKLILMKERNLFFLGGGGQ